MLRFRALPALLLLVLLALGSAPGARAGTLDRDGTFGTSGLADVPGDHSGRWRVLSVLSDGRFLAAGLTPEGQGAVARFSAEGRLDTTWAADAATPGVARVVAQAGVTPTTLVPLADGRVLLGATVREASTDTPSLLVARLTADGHLDASFGTGGVSVARVGAGTTMGQIARLSDGRIVAAGRGTTSGDDVGVVVRFSADGARDTAFGASGAVQVAPSGVAAGLDAIVVDADDRAVVTGGSGSPRQKVLVARVLPGGSVDTSYGTAGTGLVRTDLDGAAAADYDVEGRRVRLDAAGRALVLATVRRTSGGTSHLVGLARLSAAGTLDPGFGAGGTRTQDVSPSHSADLVDLAGLPGGGFVAAGSMVVGSTVQYAFAGYHDDGSADTALNPGATVKNAANLQVAAGNHDTAEAVAVTPAGRLLASGTALAGHDEDQSVIVRLGGDAHGPSAAFSPSYAATAPGRAIRPGQVVSFDASASSDPDGPIAKFEWDLDANGVIDHTGPKVSTTYAHPGAIGVLLRVTDADGQTATSGATLDVVANTAPTVAFGGVDGTLMAGAPVTLRATGADADGKVSGYAFDLDGDGLYEANTGTTPSTKATFPKKGAVTVGIRVTDDEGAASFVKAVLQVKDAPCIDNPLIKIGKLRVITQGADQAGGAGCFHAATVTKDGVRTTAYTSTGHFRVNGLFVDTVGASDATLTWKRKVSGTTEGATTELTLAAQNASVQGTSKGADVAFRDGPISWDMADGTLKGFTADANASIGGLPLKVPGVPSLNEDGTSELDVFPGTPSELLSKTPAKATHMMFGPVGNAATLGEFTFEVDEIPLGVVTLGPVKITYGGFGTGDWTIEAKAEMQAPVPVFAAGKLVIIDGHVKSVDLELTGAIPTPTPIVITALGMHIDFGPKVAANPDCVKTVGLVETTNFDNYKALDSYAPFLRPIIEKNPQLYGSLFRRTYQKYPVPNFALCGHIGLSLAEVIDADVGFGFAHYANPYPNLFFFEGSARIAKVIDAQVGAEFTTDGYVHFNAAVKGGYPKVDPWIGWDAGLDFEYYKKQYNAQAYIKINVVPLDFTAGAEVLASNKGLAACLYFHAFGGTWRPGAGAKWGHGPKLYLFGCDVGDYKVVINHALSGDLVIGDLVPKGASSRAAGGDGVSTVVAPPSTGHGNDASFMRVAGSAPHGAALRSAVASAAAAGPEPVVLPSGLPGTVMGFVGAGAPPHVVLHGPKGEVFDTGSGNAPVQESGFAALKNKDTGVTEVVIPTPSGGTWTVEPAADSARLVEAIQADGTRPAVVTGRPGGAGHDRTLAYTVKHLPKGGHVQFAEAGDGGGGSFGDVKVDGSGTLRFHPAIGAPGKRDIQAIVYAADGFVAARQTLATYTAPAPEKPAKATRLTLKRSGKRLVLRWHASKAAARQQIDIRSPHGMNVTRILRRSAVAIPLPPARTKLVVSITASSRETIQGDAARFSVRVPAAKKARHVAKKRR